MNTAQTRTGSTAFPVARVSNAASPSVAPSQSQEWRNLPQPVRDPETSGPKEKAQDGDRNLPTAPPQSPQPESA